MLVLSRSFDESIMIGDNISVTIVDVQGDKVKIGIEAPPEIPVHRQEIYQKIQGKSLAKSRPESKSLSLKQRLDQLRYRRQG